MGGAEDSLRLAWAAGRDSRFGRRDVLLTLAAAAAPPDAPWRERCRRFLLAHLPDHLFAGFPTIDAALADTRVQASLGRLRTTFPPARVRRLVFREEARRGPWTGRVPSLALLLDEVLGPDSAVAQPEPITSESSVSRALVFPTPAAEGSPEALLNFYLTILLAIAVLLAGVLPVPHNGQGARAA